MKTKKRFDSVAMKRRGAVAVNRRLEGATHEERLAFWEARTAALLERKRQAEGTTPGNSLPSRPGVPPPEAHAADR